MEKKKIVEIGATLNELWNNLFKTAVFENHIFGTDGHRSLKRSTIPREIGYIVADFPSRSKDQNYYSYGVRSRLQNSSRITLRTLPMPPYDRPRYHPQKQI